MPIITMSKHQKLISFAAILFLLNGCGKSGSNPAPNPPSTPAASINNVSQERKTDASTFTFNVSLNKAATADVTINYTTVAGSAKENTDFKPISGKVTIASGKTTATIDVQVTGDSLRKANQEFYMQLDAPQNCTLQNNKGTATIVNEDGLYFPVDNTGYSTPDTYPGYTLAWADEFNSKTINASSWNFESGNNGGWGNNELEYYTDRTQNAFVSEGNLILEARQENFNGSAYTSTRMTTKDKKVFKFGRVDIRAKLPSTQGIWPALWMLGNNIGSVGWPACGEIDMMELLGQQPNKIYGTIHWGTSVATHGSVGTNYVLPSGSFDQEFHVYSMVWKENSIKLYIDDVEFFSAISGDVTGPYPFNNDFFFIFNIAVGGNWPGAPNGSTVFPQRMIIDYIRVFQ